MQPGLLLLDEPTANLDPDGVTEVRDAVARVLDSTGATLIVIEHRVAVWQDLVDRVIVLDAAGGVLADGHPAAVLARHGDALAASGVWVPGVHMMASRRPTESGHALISAENLSIARSRKVPVAANIDVTVRSGEVLAITGPNGSGKSTLALTLAGLLRPHAGHVVATDLLAAGAALAPVDWKSRQLLPRIGMVFQDPEHQFLTGTVRAELAVGPRALRLGREEVDRRVDMLLDRLRLAGLAEANPFTLSGGEKRRLSVATALASQPRMLVLDEPTFGQDFRTWQETVALLGELADDGAGIVAVSHDGEFIDALADRRFALAPSVTDARNGTGIR
jgi:energy-coupling factor transport system ATP-binding protein